MRKRFIIGALYIMFLLTTTITSSTSTEELQTADYLNNNTIN